MKHPVVIGLLCVLIGGIIHGIYLETNIKILYYIGGLFILVPGILIIGSMVLYIMCLIIANLFMGGHPSKRARREYEQEQEALKDYFAKRELERELSYLDEINIIPKTTEREV